MRDLLSDLIVGAAEKDDRTVVLSGDHGYALFDQIRAKRPKQFINVGVSEQAMVGYASGLAKVGFRPIVYGLAAFIPVRVLEQIKLDVCLSGFPVLFLGDGAGVVYSYLGASHHCAEDIACLRSLPGIRIYSPCDARELETCFLEAWSSGKPAYIRIGKSDRAPVHREPLKDTSPQRIATGRQPVTLVATGSMSSVAQGIARENGLTAISVPRIKPFDRDILSMLEDSELVISMEEHSRYGGLGSSLAECFTAAGLNRRLEVFALEDRFAAKCGSWQFALSEHNMSDQQLHHRVRETVASHGIRL